MIADIRIRNGRIIDPSRAIDRVGEVLVAQGRVIDAEANKNVEAMVDIDASGCVVTPGLIDFHNHIFDAGSDLCIPADASMLPAGVTAAVDAGSAGASTIELFLSTMLTQRVRFKAFMHVCPTGQGTTQFHETMKPESWGILPIFNSFSK